MGGLLLSASCCGKPFARVYQSDDDCAVQRTCCECELELSAPMASLAEADCRLCDWRGRVGVSGRSVMRISAVQGRKLVCDGAWDIKLIIKIMGFSPTRRYTLSRVILHKLVSNLPSFHDYFPGFVPCMGGTANRKAWTT